MARYTSRYALVLAALWITCTGCGLSNVPPVDLTVLSNQVRNVVIASTANETLKNIRLEGPGFDQVVAKELHANQTIEIPYGEQAQAIIKWEPRKGEELRLFCDGYSEPLRLIIEREFIDRP